MKRILLCGVLAVCTLACVTAYAPTARVRYRTSGDDLYRVGSAAATHILYAGVQSLSVENSGAGVRFVAQADCSRSGLAGVTMEHARFVQDMLPDGSFHDVVDDDPDFLTILNQPFAIRLDAATIRDLRELHAPVPFSAASPVGGADLRGMLRSGTSGILDGHQAVGVEFRADGTFDGTLPSAANVAIRGKIHLNGTAYYDARSAMLLALEAQLTIDGSLNEEALAAAPVRIVFNRTIRIL